MTIYFWRKEKKRYLLDTKIRCPAKLAPSAAQRPVNISSHLKFKASNHSHVEIRQISFDTTYSLDRIVFKSPKLKFYGRNLLVMK